jgi:RNA polymerase-binding transcription factor DksA
VTSTKKQLEANLREAERELQDLEKRLNHRPDIGLGQGSTGAYSWEMALARKGRVVSRIEALQEALARVHAGTYGRCERCGAQIDPERLEILPTTSLCAACARANGAQPTSAPGAGA